MKALFKKRPYAFLLIWILPLLVCIILINKNSPAVEKVPDGFSSSIVALEFANTNEKVLQVLAPLSEEEIKGIDRLNRIDYVFMLCYGSFLFMFLWITKRYKSAFIYIIPLLLPIDIVFFDAIENVQMFEITRSYLKDQTLSLLSIDTLTRLEWMTHLKWGFLTLVFLIIGKMIWDNGSRLKYLSFPMVLPVLMIAIYPFKPENRVLDLYTAFIFLNFFLLIIYCGFYKRATNMK